MVSWGFSLQPGKHSQKHPLLTVWPKLEVKTAPASRKKTCSDLCLDPELTGDQLYRILFSVKLRLCWNLSSLLLLPLEDQLYFPTKWTIKQFQALFHNTALLYKLCSLMRTDSNHYLYKLMLNVKIVLAALLPSPRRRGPLVGWLVGWSVGWTPKLSSVGFFETGQKCRAEEDSIKLWSGSGEQGRSRNSLSVTDLLLVMWPVDLLCGYSYGCKSCLKVSCCL